MWRNSSLVLAVALLSCAQPQKPRAKAPPPPDPIASSEKVAFEAERRINSAEQELLALHPDSAVEHLDAADISLSNPAIERYPDAKRLRERHTELTTQVPAVREEVRKRELAAAVAAAKEKIEAARNTLKDALAEIKKRDPAEAELKRASDAVDALRAALEEASDLESKDNEYSKYSLAVRKDGADKKKAVEQRTLEVSIDRGRTEINAASASSGAAVKKIGGRDVVDADFDAAHAAVDEALAVVGKNEPFAARDQKFGKFVAEAKSKLTAQKAGIDKRRAELAAERQKNKILENQKVLAGAMKKVEAKNPVEGDFEEAKTAAAAMEALYTESQDLANKDLNFAKWLADIKKSVAASVARIEKRKLAVEIDRHRASVATLLSNVRAVVGGMTTADDAKLAEAAVAELEKALEAGDAYGAKDAAYSRFAIDARKTAVEAHKKIRDHGEFVGTETQKAKVSTELDALKTALASLEGFSVSEEQFKTADDAAAGAKKALDEGAELERKVARYAGWAAAKRKWLEDAQEKLAKRKLTIGLRQHRLLIEQTFDAAKSSVKSARAADATGQMVSDAVAALNAAKDELSKADELARQDKVFGNYVANTRAQVDKLEASISEQKSTLAFREGPLAALAEGLKLTESVNAQGPEEQQKSYMAALDKFLNCKKDGASILADYPQLARASFVVARKPAKAANVLSMCGEQAKTAESKLEGLQASVDFLEGPVKSFTKAKELLDEAAAATVPEAKKKATGEALTNFEECVEKGKILQNKHPELNKAKFDVDGQVLTLPFVVTSCQDEAKVLRGVKS